MQRLTAIFICIVVCILGFISKKLRIRHLQESIDFTVGFQKDMIEVAEYFFRHSGSLNSELPAYQRFLHNQDAMQKELGADGIITMQDRMRGIRISNYQVIVNLIQELRTESGILFNSLIKKRCQQLVGVCDDSLRRHIGNLDHELQDLDRHLFNPIVCFGEGIRTIIRLPIMVLLWLGIINDSTVGTVGSNKILQLVSSVITIVSFAASVITIILGWDEFCGFLRGWMM